MKHYTYINNTSGIRNPCTYTQVSDSIACWRKKWKSKQKTDEILKKVSANLFRASVCFVPVQIVGPLFK